MPLDSVLRPLQAAQHTSITVRLPTQLPRNSYAYQDCPLTVLWLQVPWNSMRLNVMEDTQRVYQRVVAFSTPASGSGGPLHPDTVPNKLIVVLTNEGAVNFTTTVQVTDGLSRRWAGYSYTGSVDGSGFNVSIGLEQSATFNTTLEPFTVQWWYEQ